MTKAEFEKKVKERLYKESGASGIEIDAELEKEKQWLYSFYDKADGNFERAVSLAAANFGMWV